MSASLIKEALTMRDVLTRYGYVNTGRESDRIPCPLHNGTDKNFAYKPHSFRCFVCGESGTVIDFAMRLFNLPFPDACKRLNEDFRLGLDEDKPPREAPVETPKMRERYERELETERKRLEEDIQCHALMIEIEKARERAGILKPILFDGEPFWNDGYGKAMEELSRLESELDERVAAEYYAEAETAWKKKEGKG